MDKYYIADHQSGKTIYICDSGKEGGTDYKKSIVSVLDSNYKLAEKITNLLNKKS